MAIIAILLVLFVGATMVICLYWLEKAFTATEGLDTIDSMPYIKPKARQQIDPVLVEVRQFAESATLGELNYIITRIVMAHVGPCGDYERIASVTGVLENVKQEFYRRLAAPYEDGKKEQHGDVY